MNPNDPYHQPKSNDARLDELIILTKEIRHQLDGSLNLLIRKVLHMSAQVDHLNAAVAKIQTDVAAAIADIRDLSQKLADAIAKGDPAEVLAAAEAAASQLDTTAASLEAVLPAAPTQ